MLIPERLLLGAPETPQIEQVQMQTLHFSPSFPSCTPSLPGRLVSSILFPTSKKSTDACRGSRQVLDTPPFPVLPRASNLTAVA